MTTKDDLQTVFSHLREIMKDVEWPDDVVDEVMRIRYGDDGG